MVFSRKGFFFMIPVGQDIEPFLPIHPTASIVQGLHQYDRLYVKKILA